MKRKYVILISLAFIGLGCKSEYDKGVHMLNEKKYDQALVEFGKVETSDDNFKRAQSKINYVNGLNAFNKSKFDEAKNYFDKS